jgi:hypothetical protein
MSVDFSFGIQPSMYNLTEFGFELFSFLKSFDSDAAQAIREEFPELFEDTYEDAIDEEPELVDWFTERVIDVINLSQEVQDSNYCFSGGEDWYSFEEIED